MEQHMLIICMEKSHVSKFDKGRNRRSLREEYGSLIVDHFKDTEYMAMRQYCAKIMEHLHGARMQKMLYIMQLYWKKLRRWRPEQRC